MPHELPEVGAKVVLHERDQGGKTEVEERKHSIPHTQKNKHSYVIAIMPKPTTDMHAHTHTHTHTPLINSHAVHYELIHAVNYMNAAVRAPETDLCGE